MISIAKVVKLSALTSLVSLSALGSKEGANALRLQEFQSDASGFDTKSYFLDTGKEVVVFDAQFTPSLADQLIQKIKLATKNPITHVIVTHPNPDKFGGLSPFRALGAKVVASERTKSAMPGVQSYKKAFFVNVAKMFKESEYPELVLPDLTFQKSLKLELTGVELQLIELAAAGVSSNQTVVHIPKLNALVVGDLIHPKAHAWLEGGIVDGAPTPDLKSWKVLLSSLPKRFGAQTKVYAGRGINANLGQSVKDQIQYLQVAEEVVDKQLQAALANKTAVSNETMGGFAQAISKDLEKSFPTYAFPYLVQYGVYGLVLQQNKRSVSK